MIGYLTAELAIELLEKAVDQRGRDYIYKGDEREMGVTPVCVYVESENDVLVPSCGVGLALHLGGVSTSDLDVNPAHTASQLVSDLMDQEIIGGADSIALQILNIFQSFQDRGRTWGHALDFAKVELLAARRD